MKELLEGITLLGGYKPDMGVSSLVIYATYCITMFGMISHFDAKYHTIICNPSLFIINFI